MKTLWDKNSGEPRIVESVDAREIMKHHGDQFTDVNPNGGEPQDGSLPVPVQNVENEFRREPVGDDTPEKLREQAIIRNPIDGAPHASITPPPAVTPPPGESDPLADLPADWKEHGKAEDLKKVAAAISGRAVENRKQAIEVIEAEQAKRAA